MVGEIEHEFLVFSADSPLFEVAATDAVNDILHLSDFLGSIIAKMKNLCENLKHTAITGSALASQMQGIEIGGSLKNSGFVSPVLKHFGGILSGISSSQEILADCIENVFLAPLQAFTTFEIPKIAILQQQYKKEHQANEESILRYLQGDTPNSFGMSRNASQAVLGLRALEVVQQRKKLEMSRFDFVRGVNAIKAQKNFEIAEACISVLFALRNHHRESAERLKSSSGVTNDITEHQYEARTRYSASLLPVEALSSGMSSVLDTMIERVETQLPSSTTTSNCHDGFETVDPVLVDNLYYPNLGIITSDINVTAAATEAMTRLGSIGASLMGGFSVSKPLLQNGISNSPRFDYEQRLDSEKGLSRPSLPSSLFGDVEMRMKALDRYQLERFYSPLSNLEYSGLIKQGYLLERSAVKMLVQHTWSRQWFVLDDSKLYIIKEKERGEKDGGSSLDVQVVCETMLASVRELKTSEVPFVFEISYANRSSHVLQAEGYREYGSWVGAIRLAIERRLIGATSTHFPSSSSSSNLSSCQIVSTRQLNANLVRDVLQMNKYCAECDKSDPDWVSLNLGCLICIDCSGIHRSLGVHISKVRSLTLDDLDLEEYNLLLRIGNDVCNSIWEAKGTIDPRKPRPHDLHSVREKFIKAKYLLKSFISSEEGSSTSVAKRSGVVSVKCSPDESLRAACRVDDIAAALEAIAHGADVCSSTKKNSSVLYPPLPPSVPPSSSSFIQSSHRKGSISDDPACTNVLSLPHIPPIIIDSRSANTSTGGDAIREDGEGMIKKPSCSPLHLSILCGSTACAVLLVMNGADPRSSSTDDDVTDSASSVGCDSEKYNNVTPSTINCIDGGTLAHKLPSLPLTEVAENAGHVLLAAYLRRKLDKIQTGQSSLKEVRTDATAVATTFSPVPIPTCEMSSSTHVAAPSTSFRITASEACVATDITVTRDDSISQVITADINNGKDVTILPNKTQESSFPSVSTSAIEKENGSKTAILSAQVFGLYEVPPRVTEGSEEITAVDLRDRSRGEREDGKLLEGVEEDEDDERGDEDDADEDEDEDEDDDLEDFYAALMRDESLPKVD